MSKVCLRFFLVLAIISGTHIFAQESDAKTGEAVYDFHKAGENGITAPKGTYMPQPEYTDQARRKKISGSVLLSLIVTADGTVKDPEVKKSLDAGLDKRAMETVKQWKFEPATKDGQPVAVRISVEVTFRIQ